MPEGLLRIKSKKREYVLLGILLIALALLFFAQNYIKYHDHQDYMLYRSLVYNLISVAGFFFFLPILFAASRMFENQSLLKPAGITVLAIISYALVISILLYGLGLLSSPFYPAFLKKYFLNMSLSHAMICVLIFSLKPPITSNAAEKMITVSKGRQKIHIKPSQIQYLEGMDHYVRIYSNDQMFLKKSTMKSLEELLGNDFIRVNRSYIVNKGEVDRLEQNKSSYGIILKNSVNIPVGKTYRDRITEHFTFTNK